MPAIAVNASPAIPARATRRWLRVVISGGALLGAAAGPAFAQPGAANSQLIRFGFSRSMFREVNENDARASLKAYSAMIAHDQKLTTDPDPILYEGIAEMEASLRQGKVDIVAGLSYELLALPEGLVTGPYLAAVKDHFPGVEYLVLAHVDSGIKTLADLKGRKVAVLSSARGSLAGRWLDVVLGAGGLGEPQTFFGDLSFVTKPTLAILPVFFRRIDACAVTAEAMAVATEMNPQLGRQLRILARSPAVVPVLTCFRRGFSPHLQQGIVNSLASLQASVPGRQLMTIFQSETVEARSDADLTTTRQLLADHARLHLAAPAMPARTPGAVR